MAAGQYYRRLLAVVLVAATISKVLFFGAYGAFVFSLLESLYQMAAMA